MVLLILVRTPVCVYYPSSIPALSRVHHLIASHAECPMELVAPPSCEMTKAFGPPAYSFNILSPSKMTCDSVPLLSSWRYERESRIDCRSKAPWTIERLPLSKRLIQSLGIGLGFGITRFRKSMRMLVSSSSTLVGCKCIFNR